MYNIKEIRKSKRMSQEELAEKAGVSRMIIVRLESGEEVVTKTTTLIALAKALEVPVSKIFWAKCLIS